MKLQLDAETTFSNFVETTIAYLDSLSDLAGSTKEEMDMEISDVTC